MTFTEWYEKTFGEKWTDEHAILFSIVKEYKNYCEENNVSPVFDG